MRTIWLALLLSIAAPATVSAEAVVYLIRHGEKELQGDDPALSEAGRARSSAWATLLRPAGIEVLLSSDARRARETAGIIAGHLALEQVEIPMMDVAGFVDALEFDHEGETVLIVAHTETIPSILGGLGVTEPVEIDRTEFDNLFIVNAPGSGTPTLIRLKMP